jgi:hypothetical protein
VEKQETIDDLLAELSKALGNYAEPAGPQNDGGDVPVEKPLLREINVPAEALEEPAPLPTWLTTIPKRSRRLTDLPLQTATQAEVLILQLLRQIPDFPHQGASLTIYGSDPWNAMLTFAPNSTTMAKANQYRTFLGEIICDLRKSFDVDLDPS